MAKSLLEWVVIEARDAMKDTGDEILSAGDMLLIRRVVAEFITEWTNETGEAPQTNFQTMLLIEGRLNADGIDLPEIRRRRELDAPQLIEYMKRRKRLVARGVEFI